jgi:hypothetical protein
MKIEKHVISSFVLATGEQMIYCFLICRHELVPSCYLFSFVACKHTVAVFHGKQKPTCNYLYLRLLGHFHTQVTSVSDEVRNYDFSQGRKSVVLKNICMYHNVQYFTKNEKKIYFS